MAENETPETEPREEWDRLPEESRVAYAAFCYYYVLPPLQRSIDAAWRKFQAEPKEPPADRTRNVRINKLGGVGKLPYQPTPPPPPPTNPFAPGNWRQWSSKHDWVRRADAWDDHVADLKEDEWIERREQLRQMDWDLGMELRAIVHEGLIVSRDFIRRRVVNIPADEGQPAQTIITEQFDITGLAMVAEKMTKIMDKATQATGDGKNYKGGILDKLIEREIARVTGHTDGDIDGE